MLAKTQKFRSKLAAIVGSQAFFWVVIGVFVFEAAWIALSARYPMAFDEGTHLGMIKLYADQFSPLLLQQPPGPALFGEVVHNPSYLYYWLMSWPYRWLHPAVDFHTLVVLLRFLNIAFFAGGMILFRKIFQKTKATPATIHTTLLFFALIPIVPLLAGQINYDNLLFLLLAWNLLLLVRFRERLMVKKNLRVGLLLAILSVGMLASLVKYAYTPIFLGVVLYLVYLLWSARKVVRTTWRKNWRALASTQKYSLLVLFAVSAGLFVSMYGYNLAKYQRIAPKCDQVLSVDRCLAFEPWARNYHYAQQPLADTNYSPLVFTAGWIQGMFDRTFFVINGPTGPEPYYNKPPLPLVSLAAIGTFIVAFYPVVRFRKQIFGGDPVLKALLFISFVYVAVLWIDLYFAYLRLDRLVAINGRYLLLAILPVLLVICRAYQEWMPRRWRGWFFGALFVLFMQGGGIISFIYFSNANWYWENQPNVLRINQSVQKVIHPFILNWPPGWKL